jgi:ribosome-associated protein
MTDQVVQLRGEWIALNDLLKVAGVSDSGGAAKLLIASGAVRVDGIVETRKTKKIRAGQLVEAAGVSIRLEAS